MNYLNNLYKNLRNDFKLNEYKDKKSLSRKVTLDNGIDIIIFLIKNNWQRKVAILLDKDDENLNIADINGISFEIIDEIMDNKMYSCLLMEQSNDDFIIFEIVVDNIISELNKLKYKQNKSEVIYNCVSRWRQFFERENDIKMSDNKQQGLYAELVLLEKLISENSEKMVLCWTGCEKELHDFYINNNAIEVKSSSIRRPYQIRVSSEYQLAKTDISGDLLLFCVFLKKSIRDGENLCEIIERIKYLLKDDEFCLSEFRKKLFLAGYIDGNNDLYKCYFRKRDNKYFEVTEDFPCISINNIMPGITHINYTISIDKCEKYEINEEMFFNMLGDKNK